MGEEIYTLKEEWWLTEDKSQAVRPGAEGKFVLGIAGSRIPLSEAKRLGLVSDAPKVAPVAIPEPEAKVEPVPELEVVETPAPKPKK